MWPYLAMFLVPATAAFVERTSQAGRGAKGRGGLLQWVAVGCVIAILVGYRFNVGGDWFNYFQYLDLVEGQSFFDVLALSDPGFMLVNWISVQLGWGVVGVNLLTAPLFAVALTKFCRHLPRPWLALAIAVPYLLIVVAMGYSRQAVALSCAMLGLTALSRRQLVPFVIWVILGATFHKTAVLLLPIAALVHSRNRWWGIAWVAAVTAGAYGLLLSDSAEDLYENYVVAQYQSEGALIRLLMNAVPAALLLWKEKSFGLEKTEASLWRWFARFSILLLVLLFATGASTALDRLGLYMLPLQLVVFARVPDVFGRGVRNTQAWAGAVILYYSAVLLTWLNFADHAGYWLPYRFYPLEMLG
jgi:hypothetical protein